MTEQSEYQGGAHRLEDAEPTQRSLPLRGLAMILIAVAVLLVAWGIYAANSEEDTVAEVEPTQVEQTQEPTQTQQQSEEAEQPQQSPEPTEQAQPVKQVTVLNNSTVQGMAADVANTLAAEGWQKGEVGNFSDAVLPQNTVYFNPQNPGAEQSARELADRVGGVAQAGGPASDPNALVLVLAKNIP
ncbi:LytR C-terminal domain-containing protein [Corynebacterium pseudopelargi]|uniref:LytR/CpsA/Psr regulator C-terminal domain-containing protein n=1 Tax=Corynebacterium pseudopelargi TaxID=2080757 RepID=A0A3G6IS41_9CORY|nr:LytR C-terminal domain-containing protein [Corynebacterium pseudopelargi]AZA08435.1 hypothetical protein CPPEL_01440 [Corynebacterium pseudopelargi]